MTAPLASAAFRSLTRTAVVGTSFARRRRLPHRLPSVWHRTLTGATPFKRPGLEKLSAISPEYALPADWTSRIYPPRPPYLFVSAVSRVMLLQHEVNDTAYILHLATNMCDPAAVRNAYRMYASACRRLSTVPSETMAPAYSNMRLSLKFVAEAMDLLATTGAEEDNKALETMVDDLKNLWWPVILYHMDTSRDSMTSNYVVEVEHLIRFGLRDKALELLFRIHNLHQPGSPQMRDTYAAVDFRPSWRLILRSFCDERAFERVQQLLQEVSAIATEKVIISLYHTTLKLFCNMDPQPPEEEFRKYAPFLAETMKQTHIGPTFAGPVSTLLRVYSRFGMVEAADRAIETLFQIHEAYSQPNGRPYKADRLPRSAWEAMLEHAIRSRNIRESWFYVEQLARNDQVAAPTHLKAVVQLERQHAQDVARLKGSMSGLSTTRSYSDGVEGASENEDDGNDPKRTALRSIMRALAEDENPTEKALEAYSAAKARGLPPSSQLLTSIVARLCSLDEPPAGGFQRALDLFMELDAAYPVDGVDTGPASLNAPDGPNQPLATSLLKALTAHPTLKDVTTVLTVVRRRNIPIRPQVLQSLAINCVREARDHQEAYEYVRQVYHLLDGEAVQLAVFRAWISATYPATNSFVAPAEHVLSVLSESSINVPDMTGPRVSMLIRRYHVVGRHVWATYGSSDQGRAALTELYQSLVIIHNAINHCAEPGALLNRRSMLDHRMLVRLYALMMENYAELGQPEETLKIFDMLFEQHSLSTSALEAAIDACRRINDWKLLISIWIKVRVAHENGELRKGVDDVQYSKHLWDECMSSLAPANAVLKSAADVVDEAMRSGTVYHSRRRFSETDCETALYVIKLFDMVGGEQGRTVIIQDMCKYITITIRDLLRKDKLSGITKDERGMYHYHPQLQSLPQSLPQPLPEPLPQSLPEPQFQSWPAPPQPVRRAPPVRPMDGRFPMFKRQNPTPTAYMRHQPVDASWETAEPRWKPKIVVGLTSELAWKHAPDPGISRRGTATPGAQPLPPPPGGRFETEPFARQADQRADYKPPPPPREPDGVEYLLPEPVEHRPPWLRPPPKKSARQIMTDLEVP
ncbi:hypothetical protein CALCODRAFT_520642 [Calocera cornea HHB12733]|uniref:Pentacotripeptide-repeat region of PRORP domain-containing protein n=1 Tax=Calocera cornea HHB12733 TaxID=1353952 RepID=A0A165DDM6_9BASI|nr:hypothetical protein CALCODRAFT_520642 [Calocera cornea HHB12733]